MGWNILHNRTNKENLEDILLQNRNICSAKQDLFFSPSFDLNVYSPFLLNDIESAIDRIRNAIENHQKIIIFGDYDVDGITSSTILYKAFQSIGYDNISVYLPHRLHDGYGLNYSIIDKFKAQDTDLIITVDCGISNVKEIDLANKLGIDVIITDHHQIPSILPNASAIIHTGLSDKYPFKNLAGVGVAYKLAWALLSRFVDESTLQSFLRWNMDIVALGTVADAQVLVDENRVFVQKGLIVMNKTQNLGLKKLYDISGISGKNIDVYDIGFTLAPRLNASGRLDSAMIGFNLLNANNEEIAYSLASQLNELNKQRQDMFKSMLDEAYTQVHRDDMSKMIILYKEDWHHGVIGLISGHMSEKFNRPVISFEKRGDVYVASARSIEGYNITDAISKYNDLLLKYGGHASAAGFSIHQDNFDKFCTLLRSHCEEVLQDKYLDPKVNIECYLEKDEISLNIFDRLSKFHPFGEGNPFPIFAIRSQVKNIDRIGKDKNHLKMALDITNQWIEAVWFNFNENKVPMIGDVIDMAFEILLDEWNGQKKVKLKVVDLIIK